MKSSGKVLVIDDEPTVREFLTMSLADDYTVISASGGMQGLELVRDEAPDLILLDIGLPDINGYRLCNMLRSDPDTQQIPIIFITAFGSAEDESRGLQAGAVDYITKPLNRTLVQARVATHLELKKQRDYLHSQSQVDELTDLANRRAFDEHLARVWQRGARTDAPVGVILIEIDGFKRYSESHGFTAGDQCLKRVASLLRDVQASSSAMMARLRNETFAVVLFDNDVETAPFLAERFRATIERACIPNGAAPESPFVTVSVGATSLLPRASFEPSSLVEAADAVLQDLKQSGGNSASASAVTATELS